MRTLVRIALVAGATVVGLLVYQASASAATAIEYGLIAALIT